MALGRRKGKQTELFIATAQLVKGPGHPFYVKLNEVLAGAALTSSSSDSAPPIIRMADGHPLRRAFTFA